MYLKAHSKTGIFNRCAIQGGRTISLRSRDHLHAALLAQRDQLLPSCVIHVDHRCLQKRPFKQRTLSQPVGLHRLVIVQMVLREIGEHGHANLRASHAVLGDANARCFHRTRSCACITQTRKFRLQHHRVWCGQARRYHVSRRSYAQSAH